MLLLGEQRHNNTMGNLGMNTLPKIVTQQRRDCDLNPGPSTPESSKLTTWLQSHPVHDQKSARWSAQINSQCI